MTDIKLLVCYHKKAPLFRDRIMVPIHVGRASAGKWADKNKEEYSWLTENMIGDNTGDNISNRNASYNEMTALYWAWKNYDHLGNPDYIGLAHYRRHFVLNGMEERVYNIRNFDKDTYLNTIGYSEERMRSLVQDCDFITHIGQVKNVYRHFIENQRKEDLDLANEILLEKYPEYAPIMKEYYEGDESNFCNMNIFSRKLFFQYCEWIFSILEEFERRTDMTEKRLFISERLTGIYIAKLMKDDTLKYKTLPISFIEEPLEIPIAVSVKRGRELSAAVSMASIMEAADGYHRIHFYLFGNDPEGKEEKKYKYFAEKYENIKVDFLDCNIPKEILPLYLPGFLPKVNKCIYLSGDVLAMFDIGEFYRICSVDDYYVVGIPKGSYCPGEKIKEVIGGLLVLNCRRMRIHDIGAMADGVQGQRREDWNHLNRLCSGQIGYIPWYLYTSERLEKMSGSLFEKGKARIQVQEEALWRPFLVYDMENPVENYQGVYSIFWWNILENVPLYFQTLKVRLPVLEELCQEQQKEIEEKVLSDGREDWRSYGFWGKLKFYHKYNGTGKTICFLWGKVFGRRGRAQ